MSGKLTSAASASIFFFELLVLQRFKLVEDGLDYVRVYPHHCHNQQLARAPQVQIEPVAAPLDDPDQQRNQQASEHVRDELGLHHIREEKLVRHLVEAVPLLNHEVAV